ncbi:MAG TPA: CPCC family cysteine-rich protein [Thiolinea sp.]|nr:CPCC family cysteine-rich protein [Thiolinea sp.]
MNMSYACPCCGYLTFDEEPPGTFEICPICGWEDDEAQFRDTTYDGGANVVSLEEARKNFITIGAINEESLGSVRRPLPEEIPDG